jgi:hypothetical protein
MTPPRAPSSSSSSDLGVGSGTRPPVCRSIDWVDVGEETSVLDPNDIVPVCVVCVVCVNQVDARRSSLIAASMSDGCV